MRQLSSLKHPATPSVYFGKIERKSLTDFLLLDKTAGFSSHKAPSGGSLAAPSETTVVTVDSVFEMQTAAPLNRSSKNANFFKSIDGILFR